MTALTRVDPVLREAIQLLETLGDSWTDWPNPSPSVREKAIERLVSAGLIEAAWWTYSRMEFADRPAEKCDLLVEVQGHWTVDALRAEVSQYWPRHWFTPDKATVGHTTFSVGQIVQVRLTEHGVLAADDCRSGVDAHRNAAFQFARGGVSHPKLRCRIRSAGNVQDVHENLWEESSVSNASVAVSAAMATATATNNVEITVPVPVVHVHNHFTVPPSQQAGKEPPPQAEIPSAPTVTAGNGDPPHDSSKKYSGPKRAAKDIDAQALSWARLNAEPEESYASVAQRFVESCKEIQRSKRESETVRLTQTLYRRRNEWKTVLRDNP